jgi:phosphoribosylformylglycinamidine synthase
LETCSESLDTWWRVAVGRGRHHDEDLGRRAARLGHVGLTIRSFDLYFVAGCGTSDDIREFVDVLLTDAVGDAPIIGRPDAAPGEVRVEVALRPGVTDRVAAQAELSAKKVGLNVRVATGALHLVGGLDSSGSSLESVAESLFANAVIETWSTGDVTPGFVAADDVPLPTEVVPLRGLTESDLGRMNAARGLALDPLELVAVRDWCERAGRDLTDAEVEMIAQTWSEHCSHKTFRARITLDGREIEPLLTQLRRSTRAIGAPFVVSAFDGNAGIVQFGSLPPLAVKVETHNHPSAVEPFGGANTGVGGVVRDVLAAPARPVALTDVLCFGHGDTPPEMVPAGTLHPSVTKEGVVAGIGDYGNKIGVPTIAGAVLYDDGFVANPLVFCGCVGVVARGASRLDGPHVGDRIVVVGGATGRDGIKGATFSSMTMDISTGVIAGASVQIGDPIVERLVGEVLEVMFDRDEPLCTALTDCGAGGLSSAIGEMGAEVGATVQLRHVPRKYPGLAPWEVWLSEAQERMVLAVPPAHLDEVMTLCTDHGVLAAEVGRFTGDARMTVLDGREVVVDLPMEFLHEGRPQREMGAVSRHVPDPSTSRPVVADAASMLLSLLSHPTIASKESVVRRFDHEVLGGTLIGPMSAPHQTGPSDGTVIVEPLAREGFALGVGVNPQYGVFDPYSMAWSCVDEALRNVVCAGADPSSTALLDNFSWGDPRRPETLAGLVAAVRGCCDAAAAHAAPFVSGKDSLNNEYETVDGTRRSVPPTLVVTALAHVPDGDVVPSTSFVALGSAVVLTGTTTEELRGSHLDIVLGVDGGGSCPTPDLSAPDRYRLIHGLIRSGDVLAAHDVSEGGLAVALAEMVLGSDGLGLDAHLEEVHADPTVAMFAESNGRLVLEVPADRVDHVVSMTGGVDLGRVSPRDGLRLTAAEIRVDLGRADLAGAWEGRR